MNVILRCPHGDLQGSYNTLETLVASQVVLFILLLSDVVSLVKFVQLFTRVRRGSENLQQWWVFYPSRIMGVWCLRAEG